VLLYPNLRFDLDPHSSQPESTRIFPKNTFFGNFGTKIGLSRLKPIFGSKWRFEAVDPDVTECEVSGVSGYIICRVSEYILNWV